MCDVDSSVSDVSGVPSMGDGRRGRGWGGVDS